RLNSLGRPGTSVQSSPEPVVPDRRGAAELAMRPHRGPRGALAAPPPGLEMTERVPMTIPLRVSAAGAFDVGSPSPHEMPCAAAPPAEALARLAALVCADARAPPGALPACLPEERVSSDLWVNAVVATAPGLNAEGLREAMLLFDRAVENIKQAEALDRTGMIASTCAAGGVFMQMPHLATARTGPR
ncbi:unnamed protein product, partial [Prorocentrum cordatum]